MNATPQTPDFDRAAGTHASAGPVPLRNPERVEQMRALICGIEFADEARREMPDNVTVSAGHGQLMDMFARLAYEATAEL